MKVELDYNPYLQKTEIMFNGKKPGINSRAEKLQDMVLSDWIEHLPEIFEEEMNGLGFDLIFSGTRLDAELLGNVLKNQNISESEIHFYRQHMVRERQDQLNILAEVQQWLTDHPIDFFNSAEFLEDNLHNLKTSFGFINFGNQITAFPELFHQPINIIDGQAADQVELLIEKKYPVVIDLPEAITPDSIELFSEKIDKIRKIADLDKAYVFFNTANSAKSEHQSKLTLRLLSSLGFKEPELIRTLFDPEIFKYMITHQAVLPIQRSIMIFNALENRLQIKTDEQISLQNQDIAKIRLEIQQLKNELSELIHLKNQFSEISFSVLPDRAENRIGRYLQIIQNWNRRKNKVTSIKEAYGLANDLNQEIQSNYRILRKNLNDDLLAAKEDVRSSFSRLYQSIEHNLPIRLIDPSGLPDLQFEQIPEIVETVLELKQEKMSMKDDLFQAFKGLTTQNQPADSAETVYYLESWRNEAAQIIDSSLETVRKSFTDIYSLFGQNLADQFIRQLEMEIKKNTLDQNQKHEQISDIQASITFIRDWFSEFQSEIKKLDGEMYE